MRLLLFDIDGTLLHGAGVGMRAMARAFHHRFGIVDSLTDIEPHGKTDPLIFREVLRSRSLVRQADDEDRLVAEIAVLYERYLNEEMPRADQARLLPGVPELLQALQPLDRVVLGLLTGNLERTARIKLRHFGIDRFFPVGAFASDAETRSQLVPIAVARAVRHCGKPIPLGPDVLVIGDTPLDVACALDNGVTAVAVATNGRHTTQQLRQAGAHILLDDLGSTEAVVSTLLGADPAGSRPHA